MLVERGGRGGLVPRLGLDCGSEMGQALGAADHSPPPSVSLSNIPKSTGTCVLRTSSSSSLFGSP